MAILKNGQRLLHHPAVHLLTSPMQNHNSNSPDNLFLRGHASLRHKRPRLFGTLALLCLGPLFVLLLVLLWLGVFQLKQDVAVQADNTGTELTRQLASLVAEPLAANDTLSMNIILAQWVQNPLIAHASLTATNQRTVAEAGRKPNTHKLAPGKGRFTAMVHSQDEQIGQLELSLAREPFTAPAATLVERLLWVLGVVTLVGCFIAWRVAINIRRVLTGLGEWYGDQGVVAPGVRRADEIGDLARRLNERRITDLPPLPEPEPVIEPEPEFEEEIDSPVANTPLAEGLKDDQDLSDDQDSDSENIENPVSGPDDLNVAEAAVEDHEVDAQQSSTEEPSEPAVEPAPIPAPSAVLAVRLGNQPALHRLPRPRLLSLLERYREQLEQSTSLSGGELHTLDDGTSLILFHPPSDDPLGRALCAGELLRVLGHDLQLAVADTGIVPHIQLALCHAPLVNIPLEDLPIQSPACAKMFERMQHSRNLLLLDTDLATGALLQEKAMVRRLASQPDTYCVERLRQPYQNRLEQHVTAFSSTDSQ